MPNYVKVKLGTVIQSDTTGGPVPKGFIPAPDWVVPGHLYHDGKFSIAEAAANTASDAVALSRRQLIRGLLREGYITPDEAVADPVVIPAFLEAAFSPLDPLARAEAIVDWRAAQEFRKHDALFMYILPALAHDTKRTFLAAELTLFFNTYSAL